MRNPIIIIIFRSLGRLFSNNEAIYKLEDRLANSAPVRQLARTLVALFQRGSWELKQLKFPTDAQARLGKPESLSDLQEGFKRRLKQYEEELKRKLQEK